MNYYIGEAAGEVYEFLADQKNCEATISKIKKELNKSKNITEGFVNMGIGWLSHEGKVDLSGKGERTKIRLVEENN